jgi:hypothetical protein
MPGETDLSVVSYYAIAIPRAFWAGWSWSIGQGLLFNSLFVAAAIAFEFLRFLWRRRGRAAAMRGFWEYARETAIAFARPLALLMFGVFVFFFITDAPRQLADAHSETNGWKQAWVKQATEDQRTISTLHSEIDTLNRPVVIFSYSDKNVKKIPGGKITNSTTPRTVVFVGVHVNKRLAGASPYLTLIKLITDASDDILSFSPFSSKQHMRLGWYDPSHICEPRAVSDDDYFIAFNIFERGKRLDLYTCTTAAELDPIYHNIPTGIYKVVFAIEDSTLERAATQAFKLEWNGNPGEFSMSKIDE